jgi:hypothetical protein
VNQLLDKNLEINLGYQCLNCKEEKNIPSGILLRLFIRVRQWGLDYESRAEYCSSQDSGFDA